MLINSKSVSTLLATSVAGLTMAFTYLVPNTSLGSIFVAGAISFATSLLFVYVAFEFLIFKEITELHQKLVKIKKKEFSTKQLDEEGEFSLNPFKLINLELANYAKQKQLEIEEMQRAEQFRRDFIADISHELKTPIFAAQGFISTLIDGAVDDENVRDKFLRKAEKSLDTLSHLVRDFILLSKIESGDISMKIVEFDLINLAIEVLDECEFSAYERKVKLRLQSIKRKGVIVRGDYQRIKQVLVNLIQNAIKYGNDEGVVIFRIVEKNNIVKISIKDNGPGIPAEHLGRIFERFYRIEKSRAKSEGGSGLGLAIVKHILRKHNTNISVKSTLNEGTTFSFRLPVAVPVIKNNETNNNNVIFETNKI